MQLSMPVAGRLDPYNLDLRIVEEGVEQADGVRAAADAGDEGIRQAALRPSRICSRVSRPMMDWKSRTIIG